MYHIGIIGHSPEHIKDVEQFKRRINYVVDLINHQYCENLIINIDGNIGVGHWIAEECLNMKIKYHLILPCPIEGVSNYWYREQKDQLKKYYDNSWQNTICSPNYNPDNKKVLADNSNFVICFWDGRKQGNTFGCIKYCIENNKMVIDGVNDLKMITSRDLI